MHGTRAHACRYSMHAACGCHAPLGLLPVVGCTGFRRRRLRRFWACCSCLLTRASRATCSCPGLHLWKRPLGAWPQLIPLHRRACRRGACERQGPGRRLWAWRACWACVCSSASDIGRPATRRPAIAGRRCLGRAPCCSLLVCAARRATRSLWRQLQTPSRCKDGSGARRSAAHQGAARMAPAQRKQDPAAAGTPS